MKEICENHINEIIDTLDKKNEQLTIYKTKTLFEIIINFIILNKFILYGGFAINTYLPFKNKIYEKDNLNDLDCYCLCPKLQSKKLGDLLAKNGFKYIEIKMSSMNKKVYKIFVEFTPVCDLHEISIDDYNYFLNMNNNKTINNFHLLPKEILKYNMVKELSNPITSYYRWDKVFIRHRLFEKKFKLSISQKIIKKYPIPDIFLILNKLKEYIKKEGLPILGIYGLELHKKNVNKKNYIIDNEYDSFLEIISLNYKKNIIDIIKIFPELKFINYKENIQFIYTISDKNPINILKIHINSDCISYCKIDNYKVLTLFGIQSFFYKNYIDNFFRKNVNFIYFINETNKIIKETNCKDTKLLSTECYGVSVNVKQLRKKLWNENFIRYRPSINKSNKSLFI
jgi:hypothetical protein